MTRAEILRTLAAHRGPVEPIAEATSAPADRFRLGDGTVVGVISSTTAPFCRDCDRARLTADGTWFQCLYATEGLDLRAPLRHGASDDDLRALIAGRWSARDDRGAEQRLALVDRSVFAPADTLRANTHLEMHTRGG